MIATAFVVRRVRPEDWPRLRALRLEALEDTPMGFLERYEDALKVADEGLAISRSSGQRGGRLGPVRGCTGRRALCRNHGRLSGHLRLRRGVAGSGVRHACLARSRSSRDRRTPRCCRRLGAQPQCFPHAARGARGQCVGARVLSPARLCRDRAAQAVIRWTRPRTSSSWRCRSTQPTGGLYSSVKQLTKLRHRSPVAGCDRAVEVLLAHGLH